MKKGLTINKIIIAIIIILIMSFAIQGNVYAVDVPGVDAGGGGGGGRRRTIK